jgi:tRNA (guanine37-N1)-methyltransferase
LSGGEIPAMAVADAVARLIPGVLGNEESLVNESFSALPSSLFPFPSSFDFPHYTQPSEYKGWKVPEVLRSGNHAEIQKWREEEAKKKILSVD